MLCEFFREEWGKLLKKNGRVSSLPLLKNLRQILS
jgi:hypothetical protein